MIESIILAYLSNNLNVPVYMEKPNDGEKYVVIEKTGSSERNHICFATFAFQSYADTLLNAAQLNEDVKAVMATIITLPEVSKVSLNSDYNYTDTNTKEYRYQAVYDLVHF